MWKRLCKKSWTQRTHYCYSWKEEAWKMQSMPKCICSKEQSETSYEEHAQCWSQIRSKWEQHLGFLRPILSWNTLPRIIHHLRPVSILRLSVVFTIALKLSLVSFRRHQDSRPWQPRSPSIGRERDLCRITWKSLLSRRWLPVGVWAAYFTEILKIWAYIRQLSLDWKCMSCIFKIKSFRHISAALWITPVWLPRPLPTSRPTGMPISKL